MQGMCPLSTAQFPKYVPQHLMSSASTCGSKTFLAKQKLPLKGSLPNASNSAVAAPLAPRAKETCGSKTFLAKQKLLLKGSLPNALASVGSAPRLGGGGVGVLFADVFDDILYQHLEVVVLLQCSGHVIDRIYDR